MHRLNGSISILNIPLVLVVASYTDKFKGCYKKWWHNSNFGFQGYTEPFIPNIKYTIFYVEHMLLAVFLKAKVFQK